MSDLMIWTGAGAVGETLDLLRLPYTDNRDGQEVQFAWGQVGTLADPLNHWTHWREKDMVCGWLGDLVKARERVRNLAEAAGDVLAGRMSVGRFAEGDGCLELNGAFVVWYANDHGAMLITDPLNFTPVYAARASADGLCVCTHLDLAALRGGSFDQLDPVSAGEYLSIGAMTFPHTVYGGVRELEPGAVHLWRWRDGGLHYEHQAYWNAPVELAPAAADEEDLARELTLAMRAAVEERCQPDVGVFLSGGLDSRAILAAIPRDVNAVALTICDRENRETRTAQTIARIYRRPWELLRRDPDYVARSLEPVTRFTGCQSDWAHAHVIGLAEQLREKGLTGYFNGCWVGCFLRAPLAEEFTLRLRCRGVLGRQWDWRYCDWVRYPLRAFASELRPDMAEQVIQRRQAYYDKEADPSRLSQLEWLSLRPISNTCELAAWMSERRVLPTLSLGMDRRLIEFGFRCPKRFMLDGRIFAKAMLPIYGPGARIPNANDGVRPGSGHTWRLAQRLVRKSSERSVRVLERLGRTKRIEHSWHDYQQYWRTSPLLEEFRGRFEPAVEWLDGAVLRGTARDMLYNGDTYWNHGFRLIQLAHWNASRERYRDRIASSQIRRTYQRRIRSA